MSEFIRSLLNYLNNLYPIPIVFLILIIFYFLLNPDKVERWAAIIYRVFYFLLSTAPKFIKSTIDRRTVATSIQNTINSICEQINKEAPDIIPYPVKIEWVNSQNVESYMYQRQIIVRLRHFSNQDKNIVNTTLWYLKSGFLPKSKNFLDDSLKRSCEYKIAVKIFSARRDSGALDYFIEKELKPSLNSDINLQNDLQLLEDLDSIGFFTRVFLIEIKFTGEKLLGAIPTSLIQQEIRNFAEFLREIAKKGKHEDVPLSFKGQKIKSAIILVARHEILEKYGIEPYVRRISKLVNNGYESIYITGWGEEFVKKVIQIKNEAKRESIIVLRRYDYLLGENRKGILFICQSNYNYLARQKKLQDEIVQNTTKIIPEIASGEIIIHSIARIKGIGCKILVKWQSREDHEEAKKICAGENNEKIEKLKMELNTNEFISFIPYSDNVSELIINALTPLKKHEISSITIDEKNLISTIKVSSKRYLKKALGENKYNLWLAIQLTGWEIIVECPNKTTKKISAEEELELILRKYIPEINNNKIKIIKIARIKNIGARVIVKWGEGNRHGLNIYKVCKGENEENLFNIQEETGGEWIYFHEWSEDIQELISTCLYPLKRSAIKKITLDNTNKIASIFLKRRTSSPSWRDENKIFLTEKITGWKLKFY
ncbi:MAG: hypothetical protein ACTSQP_24515 [Promethearchaeota archaeon]